MTLKYLWSSWNSFWFSTGSPIPIALFRIAMGFLVIAFSILFFPEAETFFGPHAIVQPGTTGAWMKAPEFSVLDFLPGQEQGPHLVLVLLAVSGVLLLLGVFSRFSALMCSLLLLSLDSRNHFVLHTGDKIMCEMLLYLVFSRCGDALSFERLARIWRTKDAEFGPAKDGSIFGQRLVQIQLAIVYWGAFSSKLHGKTWMDGTAVYFAAHLRQFQRFPVPYLLDQLWASKLFTWGTLLLEFSLCFLVWIKELRYPLLLAGVVFHVGLDWVMVIPLFQPIMLSCYICFIDSADLAKLMSVFRAVALKVAGTRLEVYYDRSHSFSERLAETVRQLDILHLVCLVDVSCSSDDRLRRFSGRSGLFAGTGEVDLPAVLAMRQLCRRLPLLLPLYLFLYLPGCESILLRGGAAIGKIYENSSAVSP